MTAKKSSLQNIFLRAGLSKEIYDSVKPLIRQENVRIMYRLAIIGFLFGAAMSILSVALKVISVHVLPAYLTLMIISLIALCVMTWYRKQGKTPGLFISYLQMSAVLIYGIMNSSFFAPGPKTMGVTVIVLITLVPFLLTDVAWRECLLIIGSSTLYLCGVYLCKDPSIWNIEATNTICFCLVSCMSSAVFTSRTIRSMADKLYIEKERDTDSLTGLSSRHSGEILIRSQLMRGIPSVFFIMDIDNFKSVNDLHGHPYGDHVLRVFGTAVSASIRRKDIACRYGGDEFCVLLTDCDMEGAHEVIERIQTFIQNNQKNEKMTLTCSFGIATAIPGEDLRDLLSRADQALYQAKRNGKNQVVDAK